MWFASILQIAHPVDEMIAGRYDVIYLLAAIVSAHAGRRF
jgi:hypothetical protein